MAILSTDLQVFHSGGNANSDPNASLGGIVSATQITDATLHNLFDQVESAEASAGDTEYRCFYFKNNHGSLALTSPSVYIDANTPSADSDIEIGLDPAGVGDGSSTGVATTIGAEGSAPAGVSFSQPSSGSPLALAGSLGAGQYQAVWVKRVISAAASAVNNDSCVIGIQGDTAA